MKQLISTVCLLAALVNTSQAQQIQLPTRPIAICLAVSPDEHNAVTGGRGTIEFWDLSTLRLVRIFTGHRSQVRHLAFSPDGNQLASASDDGTVRLWDTNTGREIRQWRIQSWNPVSKDIPPDITVDFLPDGQHLVTATGTGLVRIYPIRGTTSPLLTVSFSEAVNNIFGSDTYLLGGVAISPFDASVWVIMKGHLFWLNPGTRQLSQVTRSGGGLVFNTLRQLTADSTSYTLSNVEGNTHSLSLAPNASKLFVGHKGAKNLTVTAYQLSHPPVGPPVGKISKSFRLDAEFGTSFIVDAAGQTIFCHNATIDVPTGEIDKLSESLANLKATFLRSGRALLTLNGYSGFEMFQRRDEMAYFARMDSLKVMTLGQRPTQKDRLSWRKAGDELISKRLPKVRAGWFANNGRQALFQLDDDEETSPDSINTYAGHTDLISAIWRDLKTGEPMQQFRWRLPSDRYVPLRPEFQFCTLPNHDDCISSSTIQDSLSAPEPTQFARWHPDKSTPVAVFKQTSPYKPFVLKPLSTGNGFLSLSEKAVEVWDVHSESRLQTFTTAAPLTNACTSPDGSLLVATTGRQSETVLGLALGDQRQQQTEYQKRAAVGLNDVVVWDATTGKPISILSGHEGTLIGASFLADGRVISASRRGSIRLWDATTGVVSQSLLSPTAWLAGFSVSPDRHTVLWQRATSPGSTETIWYDVRTGKQANLSDNFTTSGVEFSPAGRHLLYVSRFWFKDGQAILFDWPLSNKKSYDNYLYGKAQAADCAVLTPNDNELIVGSIDGKVTVFNVAPKVRLRQFKAHSGAIIQLQLSPKGETLVTADSPKQLVCWNPATGERLRTIETDQSSLFSLAFSPDGTRLYTGHAAGLVCVFDVATGQRLGSWQAKTGDVRVLSLSPDGQQLLAGGGDPEALSLDETFRQQQERQRKAAGPPPAILVWALNSKNLLHTISPPGGSVPTCTAISTNNKLLATGGNDYRVRLYDLVSGQATAELPGHAATLTFIRFLPGDEQLLTRDETGYVIIWDVPTRQPLRRLQTLPGVADLSPDGKNLLIGPTLWNLTDNREVASFWRLAGGEWLTTLPDQSYAGTPEAARQVAYSIGQDAYGFDEFDLRFNRPDRVLQQLGSSDSSRIQTYQLAYQKRLRRAGQTETSLAQLRSRPVAVLTNENQLDLVTSQPTVTLHLTLHDTTARIDRLHIWVNDIPVYGLTGKALTPSATHSLTVTVPLGLADPMQLLSYQRQIIQVACTNEVGNSSYRRTLHLQSDFYDRSPKRIHFVGIGVNRYRDSTLNLRYSTKDIHDLATLFDALNERRMGKRDTSTFLTLFDEQVTRENILAVKARLRSRVGPADLVVVAMSGHGLLSDSLDFYYGTHDVDLRHPERRGLAYTDLESLLDSLPTQQKVLFLDACHAGEVDRQLQQSAAHKPTVAAGVTERGGVVGGTKSVSATDAFTLMQQAYASLTRETGAFVVAAAGGHEYAYEGDSWQNGVFTYALLQALKEKKANSNNDTYISIREVANYVQQQVRRLTQGRQIPAIRSGNPYVDFNIRNTY